MKVAHKHTNASNALGRTVALLCASSSCNGMSELAFHSALSGIITYVTKEKLSERCLTDESFTSAFRMKGLRCETRHALMRPYVSIILV